MTRHCQTCGNPLVRRRLESPKDWGLRKFCSLRCRAITTATRADRDEGREKARQMRRDGATISEIQAAIHAARSTVSDWVEGIPVPENLPLRRARPRVQGDSVAPTRWLDTPIPRLRNLIETTTEREIAVMRKLGVVGVALALLISTAALAQEHPMHPPAGMPDPYKGIRNDSGVDCCAGRECRPLAEPLRYGTEGTEVQLDGEWKAVPPGSLGPSPDGNAHICVWHVDGKPAVRCILVPGSA